MDLKLSGKRALVTGSTAGIGLAIAKSLAREAAKVTVNGRTPERVEEAIAQVEREVPPNVPGADVSGFAADLTTAEGARKLIAAFDEMDVLVNNMGIYQPKPFEELTDGDWERLFQANVLSGVRVSRHYFPKMLKAGWGRVIFISSESAVQVPAEMIHYGVTKSAQVALARGMAERTAGTEVTVNSVLAGPTRSEGVEQFVSDLARHRRVSEQQVEEEFFRTVRPTSLLQRFERPEEVAAVVTFLCSPAASAVNGAAVRAEGGVLKGML